MIEWVSEHDETRPSGEAGRYKVGVPSPDFWELYDKNAAEYEKKGWEAFITSSGRFIKAPVGILVEPPTAKIPAPKPPSFLRDFQGPQFKNLWGVYGQQTCAGDFSDTGTGKTYVSVALALELDLPVFVICLLAGMDKWKKVITEYGAKAIAVGNYEFFKTENEYGKMEATWSPYKIFEATTRVLNGKPAFCPFSKYRSFGEYKDALDFMFSKTYLRHKHVQDAQEKLGKSMRIYSRTITGYKWNLPRNCLMIFDEVHKCKSEDSQNMRLLAASKPYVTEVLTATPGVTPRDFMALGYALGMHRLYDFDLWTEQHGCRRLFTRDARKRFLGWDYNKKSRGLEKLNEELYPLRASRMRISEIPGFPKTVITAECFSAKEAPQIQKAYIELVTACKNAIEDKKMLPVTSVLRYRMFVEKMKVPLFLGLIDEALENGFSVAMFVNFTETLDLLGKKLPDAPKIHGGQNRVDREFGRLQFENNKARVILLNAEAGGASLDLHDIYGGHPRMALISPTYNPYTLKQIFGRVNRDGGKTTSFQRIVYMGGTQEEKVCDKVKVKLKAFEVVNGDITEKDLIEDGLLAVGALSENALSGVMPEEVTDILIPNEVQK